MTKRFRTNEQKRRDRENNRKWREANKEHLAAYNRRTRARKTARAKAYYKQHPEKLRARWIRDRYGIGLDEYQTILELQNNACGICRAAMPIPVRGQKLTWHVDHDHKIKRIRGLLCAKCNRGLGCFDDDPIRLKMAIEYLARGPIDLISIRSQRDLFVQNNSIAHRPEPLFALDIGGAAR